MTYISLVVVMHLLVKGSVAMVVTVVGAMLVGLYYAALRRNLPRGPDHPRPPEPGRPGYRPRPPPAFVLGR
jgi:hypothetical protein